MDSICSAYCYADLKRKIDPETEYIPIRLGRMNDLVRGVFEDAKLEPPKFVKDLRPRVIEVANPPDTFLYDHDSVYSVINELKSKTISVVPVFNNEHEYEGLISVDDITGMFMKENTPGRPKYMFRVQNFECVVDGKLLKYGKKHEFETFLMTGAMPLEISVERINQLLPEKPVLVAGMRKDLIDFAVKQQLPAIILTGYTEDDQIEYDFSSYEGTVFVSYLDTAETIRLLRLSLPIKSLIPSDVPRLQGEDLFDDALATMLDSGLRGLPVFEDNHFAGTVTRRCFIRRPKKEVILVDHNEVAQSVTGIEDAQIIEIIDHHRLAAEKTRFPIYIASVPVGSTCTIIYQHYKRYGVEIEPSVAILLLSGIMSDTVILKSPTATSEDHKAVEELCRIAGIADYREYGANMFSRTTVLTEADPQQLVESDFKTYEEFGCRFGIGQVEVGTLEDVDEVKDALLKVLEQVRKAQGLDWTMLLITNVVKEMSVLLTTAYPSAEKALIYKKEDEGKFSLPHILSRKKQLLPEILRVLEERNAPF
jgi:manganese-dependent inorganic pyrophosphatase